MTALYELIQLAKEKDYQYWDTGQQANQHQKQFNSFTFGKENVFCLHVRFDKFWRVVNAIYIKFSEDVSQHREDQYVYKQEKNKKDKIYWIMNFLPDNFEYWDELFGYPVVTPRSHYNDTMSSKSLETLQAEFDLCVEIHEMLSAPWADINDAKGTLTTKKRQLKRKIRELERAEDG